MSDVIRAYEGVVIINPDASEEVQKELFRKNKSIIENCKGAVNSLDTWGRRKLGNPIKKINYANYFYTTFTANNEAVAELERTMRINDSVLRFSHMKVKDGVDVNKHYENFKEVVAASIRRQKEAEEKAKKRNERNASRKK